MCRRPRRGATTSRVRLRGRRPHHLLGPHHLLDPRGHPHPLLPAMQTRTEIHNAHNFTTTQHHAPGKGGACASCRRRSRPSHPQQSWTTTHQEDMREDKKEKRGENVITEDTKKKKGKTKRKQTSLQIRMKEEKKRETDLITNPVVLVLITVAETIILALSFNEAAHRAWFRLEFFLVFF